MALIATGLSAWGSSIIGASTVGTFLTKNFVGRLLVSVATSALLSALSPTPGIERPGLSSEFAQTGADNPLSFMTGTFATPGTRLAPYMSHGKVDGTPNAYLTLPVAISAVGGAQLTRVHINDEWVTLGTDPHPDYGLPVLGQYEGYAWIKYYDGSQTEADPMMLAKYPAPYAYPWSADMIGTGMCLAYCTFRFNRELFSGLPAVVFETTGIPLYDPRKDPALGGTGTHDPSNQSTWESSDNLAVQMYNVARGITLFTGDVWGGGWGADRVPLSNWTAAMNACDIDVDGVPQFRGGYEIRVAQKPSDIMKVFGTACGAKFAESAGTLRVSIGAAALPVMMITDADFLINEQQTEMPFPSVKAVFNGASSTYPEPESVYKAEDAPVYTNAALEAEDHGRQNLANLQFGACPYNDQVQRLQYAMVEANRRFKRHAGSLQGAAALLEPLDTISWTSDRHGYASKIFSVPEIAADLRGCLARVSLLEEDPSDWIVPPENILPFAPAVPADPPPDLQGVPGWAFEAETVYSSDGLARYTILKMSWNVVDLDDVRGIIWSIRNANTGDVIANGTTLDFTKGFHVYSGSVLGLTSYEAQGELLVDRPTEPSGWIGAQTGQVLLSANDFDPSVTDFVEAIASRALTVIELENINIVEQYDQQPDWEGVVHLGDQMLINSTDWVGALGNTPPNGWSFDGTLGLFTVLPSGALSFDRNGDSSHDLVQSIEVEVGKEYQLSWTIIDSGGGDVRCTIEGASSDTPGFTNNALRTFLTSSAEGSFVANIVPTTSPIEVRIRPATRHRTIIFDDFGLVEGHPEPAEIFDGRLYLNGAYSGHNVIYNDAVPFDLGAVFPCRIRGGAGFEFWNRDYTWDDWGTWNEVGSWAGDTFGSKGVVEISTTTDPSEDALSNWSAWAPPVTLMVDVRGVKSRLSVTFGNASVRCSINYGTIVIDVPDRTISERNVLVPSEGLDFVFSPAFQDTPVVVATHLSPADGERLIVSEETADGVRFDIIDSAGNGVAGTININAKGYGRKGSS